MLVSRGAQQEVSNITFGAVIGVAARAWMVVVVVAKIFQDVLLPATYQSAQAFSQISLSRYEGSRSCRSCGGGQKTFLKRVERV